MKQVFTSFKFVLLFRSFKFILYVNINFFFKYFPSEIFFRRYDEKCKSVAQGVIYFSMSLMFDTYSTIIL